MASNMGEVGDLELALEQAIKEFTDTMGRIPTLEEEATLYERITRPELYAQPAQETESA